MAEASSEAGQTAQDIGRSAFDASLKYIKLPEGGAEIAIHISATNIRVAKELCKLAGYVVVGTGVTTLGVLLGYKMLKPLVESAVKEVLGEVDKITPGSLHVVIHCLTVERFLKIVDDYESGRIAERLKDEFSQFGMEVEGLKVEIENIEEVNKTKEAINKKRGTFREAEATSIAENLPEVHKEKEDQPTSCLPDKLTKITERKIEIHEKEAQVNRGLEHWSLSQKQRLTQEKKQLEHIFRNVKWIDPTRNIKVEVTLKTSNDMEYTLRVYLQSDFPFSVPDMVVVRSPKPMPDWENDPVNHTLPKRDGYLRICHHSTKQYTGSPRLYEIFMKGLIWLEAYEGVLTADPSDKPEMPNFIRNADAVEEV